MIKLFEDIDRVDTGYSKENENPYDFYNRSAIPNFTIIRNLLNQWFFEFPEKEKNELKQRFKKDFYPAFYELFLFQLFRNLGFSIKIHPKVPKSTHRPDFLIKKGDLEIYIEAKVDKDRSKKEEAFDRKESEFYDQLGKLEINGFYIWVEELIFKSKYQPKTKKIRNTILKDLNKLNPLLLAKQVKENGYESLKKIKYEDDDVKIIFLPLPLEQQKKIKKPIGAKPIKIFVGAGIDSLRKSIVKKANRYGKLDKPFIICINAMSGKTQDNLDIQNAIWGSIGLSISNFDSSEWKRRSDGIFFNKNKIQLKNLSGVLITKVVPTNIPNVNYWLFKNPFSNNTFDFNKLGLKYTYIEEKKICENIGNNLDEILKISKDWIDLNRKFL